MMWVNFDQNSKQLMKYPNFLMDFFLNLIFGQICHCEKNGDGHLLTLAMTENVSEFLEKLMLFIHRLPKNSAGAEVSEGVDCVEDDFGLFWLH